MENNVKFFFFINKKYDIKFLANYSLYSTKIITGFENFLVAKYLNFYNNSFDYRIYCKLFLSNSSNSHYSRYNGVTEFLKASRINSFLSLKTKLNFY